MKLLIFPLFAVAAMLPAQAQTPAGSLTGRVLDVQSQPVAGAAVFASRNQDTVWLLAGRSDTSGRFRLEPLPEGRYWVGARTEGLPLVWAGPVAVPADATPAVVPDLVLASSLQSSLREVAVRAQKPLIETRGGKTIVHVDASITATGSTALEVLARAPGVTVDGNDRVALKGRAGVAVLIDGKTVPVQGTDLANLLKSMPSGSIDKIELLANPGARYDAAGTGGIINIRLKKDQRLGANGTLTAGLGQGVYPKGNAGATLNYRNAKLSVYGTYNYARRDGFNRLRLDRQFLQPRTGLDERREPVGAYRQDNFGKLVYDSHYASGGVDYTVSAKTVLGAVLTAGRNGFSFEGDNRSDVFNASGAPVSYFRTATDNSNRYANLGANLNLRHRFDTAGRGLTVDADAARYTTRILQDLTARYYGFGTGEIARPYRLLGDLDGKTTIRTLKADYTHPLRNGVRLEAGLKTSFVTADNEPVFYDRSSGVDRFDSTKSNHFVYDENINAVYLNATHEGANWDLQAGLRAEQTRVRGVQNVQAQDFDRVYTQLFPSLNLTRHLSPSHDLGLTVSRRIERPTYQQLNPFRNYIDPSSVHQGNPYLNPARTTALELTHTYKNRLSTSIGYSRTTDGITQVILPEVNPADSSQLTVVTDRNLATVSIYSLSGSYPAQVTPWWNTVHSFNAYYAHYEGAIAGTPLAAGMPAIQVSATHTFTLPRDWSGELSGWYQSRQRYGYMALLDQYSVNVGIQKSLWKKTATLKLAATDLLWRQNPRGRNEFLNYYETFEVQRDTRVVTASFTYRFGKRTVAPVRRRSTGSEDERQRSGGTSGA